MGITLDGSVTCVRAPRAEERGSSEERGEQRERWADLLSDGENDEEETVGRCKKKSVGDFEAKGAQQVAKRPPAWKEEKKTPPASTRGSKKSEHAVWAEVGRQSKWKVKDAAGKSSAATPSAQKAWVDDWSHESAWDDEWSSSWDDDWAEGGKGYGQKGGKGYEGYDEWAEGGEWSHQWAAPRDAGRKLQCQFHIQIEEEPEFRVCRRLLGPAGKHMKAIAEKTGGRLRLRGRGSRFREGPQWQESDDPLMLCVSAVGRGGYDEAVRLVKELLEGIYQDYTTFKASNPSLKVYMHEGAREGSGVGR